MTTTDDKSIADQIRAARDRYGNWFFGEGLRIAARIAAAGEAALRAEIAATKATQARHSAERLDALNKNAWQAQRIAVLESENGRLRADRDRLAADLAVARGALEFYSCKDGCNDCSVNERDLIGCGWTARAALARISGGGNG